MKCPKCNGKGDVPRPNGTTLFGLTEVMTCDLCHGNGEVELTNEEWFDTLSTEEKAFALETIIRSVLVQRPPMCHDVCNREFWERWLKEKHE